MCSSLNSGRGGGWYDSFVWSYRQRKRVLVIQGRTRLQVSLYSSPTHSMSFSLSLRVWQRSWWGVVILHQYAILPRRNSQWGPPESAGSHQSSANIACTVSKSTCHFPPSPVESNRERRVTRIMLECGFYKYWQSIGHSLEGQGERDYTVNNSN